MAEWMTSPKAVTANRVDATGASSRRGQLAMALPQVAMGLLCGVLSGLWGCVRQDAEPATGLVRRAPQIETLIVTSVTSKRELLGVVDVGVLEISRLARRGTMVALQVGDQVLLVDLASASSSMPEAAGAKPEAGGGVPVAPEDLATLPALRVGPGGRAIELMYGPTEAGFAVLIESGPSGLPVPAWLDDDGTVRPIATGLPAEMGVQCWLPLTSRGDVVLLAAGPAGQRPQLWMSRAGKCVRFEATDVTGAGAAQSIAAGAGNAALLDGYFLLVPSGDGSLVGAVRENGAGVYAEVFDIEQPRRLYTLRLAEFGHRNAAANRGGWSGGRRAAFVAQAADVSDDIAGSRLAARLLAGNFGPASWSGKGGAALIPLRSIDDGAVRLFGRQMGAVVRLPAQVGSVSEWSRSGVVGWATELGEKSIAATAGRGVVVPGAWALKIDLVAVSGGSGGLPVVGVVSGGRMSGSWSVSEWPSIGLGLADGGILVIERVSPGIGAFFLVRPR